ncbi:unnamed protein product [Menidia menidia]|uniref:(Atlantic silverside) hypothetical protein n=1 Tax=Menidia menidia TaxID=238744 RepID=A0A8S4BBJ2_9TELE|nr:unnamed protein product [Menidia menidia]
MAAELHPRSGKLIGLSNSNRTARRNQPVQEFNHGLVLSKEPLRDRDVFTVRIDKKRLRERRWWDEPGSARPSARSEGGCFCQAGFGGTDGRPHGCPGVGVTLPGKPVARRCGQGKRPAC